MPFCILHLETRSVVRKTNAGRVGHDELPEGSSGAAAAVRQPGTCEGSVGSSILTVSNKRKFRRYPLVSIKASVFIATSLDGFIARANGDLDWLTGTDGASTEQDYGYQEFMDRVDTIVLGRNTFELVLTFDAWPYSGKKVVVLSSRPNAVPPHLVDSVEWLSLPPQRLVERLAAQGATHLYVDGGKTIQGFLRAGPIDELTITRVPILIGTGVPLFGPLSHDVRLTHIATRQFEGGFAQSKYALRIPRDDAFRANP